MKIIITCPECGEDLTDRFCADVCRVTTGKTLLYDMECVYCGTDIKITLNIDASVAK